MGSTRHAHQPVRGAGMSTETPLTDAECAWLEWCEQSDHVSHTLLMRECFMAGRESLAARLDALHAENQRLRERNSELSQIGQGFLAERDALRDAVTALADQWHERAYSGENIIDGVFNECEVELRALMSPHECDHHWRDFLEMSGDTKRKCVKCGSLSEAGEPITRETIHRQSAERDALRDAAWEFTVLESHKLEPGDIIRMTGPNDIIRMTGPNSYDVIRPSEAGEPNE